LTNNKEKTCIALLNIKKTAHSLLNIDEQTRGWVIREILKAQNIPMLSFATPIILILASSKNLELIANTVDNILLKLDSH